MKPFIFLMTLFFVYHFGFSQEQKAEYDVRINAYLQEAMNAYEKDDYEKVIYYCNRVEELSGETSLDVEVLRLKSYYKSDQIRAAKTALDKFFSYNPNTQKLLEIEPYIVKIEEADNYRIQKERKEKEMQEKLERETYDRAVTGTPYDIKVYLSQYPEGEHYREMFDLLEQKEEELYEEVMNSMDRSKLEEYFKHFSSGKHIDQVKERANHIEEHKYYEEMLAQNTEEAFDNYLNKYPDGKYVKEINQAYADYIYENGMHNLDKKNYVAARNYFNFYESTFPDGDKIERAKEKHLDAQKGMKKDKNVAARDLHSFYLMFSYATDKNIGLELGGMSSVNRVSVYWTLEGRKPFGIFSKIADIESLPNDEVDESDFEHIYLTSTFGLNIRIAYPVWLYVGGGARAGFLEAKENSFYYDEDEANMYRLEKDFVQFFPEVGIGARALRRVALKAGMRFIDGDTEFKLGIGIIL